MGIFSSGKNGVSQAREPWLGGNGSVILRLEAFRFGKDRKKQDNDRLSLTVIAGSDLETAKLGKSYAIRYCPATYAYPESDNAKYLQMVSGLMGIPLPSNPDEPNDEELAAMAEGLDIQVDDLDLTTNGGKGTLSDRADKAYESVLEMLRSDDGEGMQGLLVYAKMVRKGESTFTSIYAEAIPGQCLSDDRKSITAEYSEALKADGFEVWEGASISG